MNWFINNGVNIINMSFGHTSGFGQYLSIDAYYDYYVRAAKVIIVKSAGNKGNSLTDYAKVTSPGNGFNIIAVGAIDQEEYVAGFSSYISVNEKKPTLVAVGSGIASIPNIPDPGTNIYHEGTSYAAPMVTGLLAVVMEAMPAVVLHPEIAISAVITGAYRLPTSGTGWDNQAGAGRASCIRTSVTAGLAVTFQNSSNTVGAIVATKSISVLRKRRIRVAVAWLANSDYSGSGSVGTNYVNNYDVRLKNSSGTVVATATSTDNNIEVLEYYVPNGSLLQDFTIEVYLASSRVNTYDDIGAITNYYVSA